MREAAKGLLKVKELQSCHKRRLHHMFIVMFDETCLVTKVLLANPTGEALNLP